MTFKTYETTSEEPKKFDPADYQVVVDAYANGETITGVKHANFIPSNVVRGIYKDIQELENTVTRLMTGKSVDYTEEVTNEDGSTETVVYYNDIPTTITGLKNKIVELVHRDFDVKAHSVYSSMEPADFEAAVKYVVDMIVKYSDGSGSNTFDTFKTYFA